MRWASFNSGKSFWYVICTQILLSKRLLNFLYKIHAQKTKQNKIVLDKENIVSTHSS